MSRVVWGIKDIKYASNHAVKTGETVVVQGKATMRNNPASNFIFYPEGTYQECEFRSNFKIVLTSEKREWIG